MKVLLYLSLLCYLIGIVQMALVFFKKFHPSFIVTLTAGLCGFSLHTASIVMRGLDVDRCPLVQPSEIISFLGWSIAGFYVIGNLWNRNRSVATYVLPAAFILTLTAALMPAPRTTPVGFRSFSNSILFPLHVSMVIFAYAAFLVTFLAGLMYIWQERELKMKRFGSRIFRLPALDTCDNVSYKSMGIGFVMLTLGMVTGILWSGRHYGIYWHGDPIEIITLLTWFT